jgi:hypothetical protein
LNTDAGLDTRLVAADLDHLLPDIETAINIDETGKPVADTFTVWTAPLARPRRTALGGRSAAAPPLAARTTDSTVSSIALIGLVASFA